MQPILTVEENQSNGPVKSTPEEKVVLPVEMASMIPLKSLIGKLIHKSYADLMTLTDTLPSMSDVEKKRQILNYTTFVRKQFLKLLVLVKWSDCADDIQMCQNIMAYLANQNKTFQDTVDYLHKIHVELPAARVRNFDIATAVDVLTTGTYQRMPTKLKDMIPPTPLTDKEVLEVFQNMNDTIRVRMLTEEVLPSPMKKYRIENGRIYFSIENEFEIALTLMGQSHARRWWIVSLDILVQASACGGASDVDISLNDVQKQHLRMNAQKQLIPPEENDEKSTGSLFFPLVNVYDYLHLCCLNMQLEMIHIQFHMLAKTRWLDQLKVQMDPERTKLVVTYWVGGSPACHWARPQTDKEAGKSTVIEISVSDEHGKESTKRNMNMIVRDETKGLIQKAGLGASVRLSELDPSEKPKIVSLLKYPKSCLDILWGDSKDLHTDINLLNASDLNAGELLIHITKYHSMCIKKKIRQSLESQKQFLQESGLSLIDEDTDTNAETGPLIIRYRQDRFVSIEVDSRTGRLRAYETKEDSKEGQVKLSGLEDRLNNDPENACHHLLWLRSDMVIREIISLAKLLNLQPYHPSQINLRPEDFTKLFGDLTSKKTDKFPAHCVFLQFAQFENWYFVLAAVKNEFKSWLCCLSKTQDQSSPHQTVVDFIHIDCDELKEIDDKVTKKRKSQECEDLENKKRRISQQISENVYNDTEKGEQTPVFVDKIYYKSKN
ncbi:mediator complex subunit MED14-domain-containing protein [Sporodiniella umbellata]|nr:mediator complex subunit MED14-domain-containing protein [Sporodiniella umbellata]